MFPLHCGVQEKQRAKCQALSRQDTSHPKMSQCSAHPPRQPRCTPAQDAKGDEKRHRMHLKQENPAKCHYLCWNPAQTLSFCPLRLAQQLSKSIQTRILSRGWI